MNHIIFWGELNSRKGGPSGYLANLNKGLEKINNKNTQVISLKPINNSIESNSSLKNYVNKSVNGLIRDLYETYYSFNYNRRNKNMLNLTNNFSINNKDTLHFHNVYDYYYAEKNFPNVKKILTTHTPESIAIEHVQRLQGRFNTDYNFNLIKSKVEKIERIAFEKCNTFIYPSKESLEPYFETIPGFEKLIQGKEFHYNMTGCEKLEYRLSRDAFLKENNIKKDSFIVSFVGRNNKVKGYDIFCEAFKKINRIDKNIIFVSAGEGDINSPKSEQFKSVGWTDDPGSLINASDVFILPNRRTFFDLILLEVLSLGKPVIASNTGGNKTIARLDSGVELFDNANVDDLVKHILNLKNNKDKLDLMAKKNLELYNNYFTLEKFAQRYQAIF